MLNETVRLHRRDIYNVYFLAFYIICVSVGLGGSTIVLLAVFPYAVMYLVYGLQHVFIVSNRLVRIGSV